MRFNPALTGTAVATGLVNGDTLAGVTTGTAAFTSAATTTTGIGQYAVSGAGHLANSANYTYSFVQAGGKTTALTIAPAPVTVTYTATAATRVYGAVNPALAGTVAATGLVNGDTLAGVTTGTAGWTTSATVASGVGGYAVTGAGLAGANANYTFSFVQAAGNATALSVTPAALQVTYTAAAKSRVYGAANPALSGAVSSTGLVNGDTLATVTTGTASWSTTATATTAVGKATIRGSGLVANSANYTITFVQAAANATALTISARPLTLTPAQVSRAVGAANPTSGAAIATAATSTTGLVNGDTVTTLTLSSPVTATSPAGSYGLTGSSAVFGTGLASNYLITYATNPTGLLVQ